MKFDREIAEYVPVNDFVQRTHTGKRSSRNYYAILALIVITGFEAFVVLSTSRYEIFVIHNLLAFLNMIAGFFAIVRNQNKLIITLRKIFAVEKKQTRNENTFKRICNICKSEFDEFPCPTCGKRDALIVKIHNEDMTIPETISTVTKNNYAKINALGLIFSILLFMVQWIFTYLNGNVIDLIISILFAFIIFIPSYYVILEIKFKDVEVLT